MTVENLVVSKALKKHFRRSSLLSSEVAKAVDGVDLEIRAGETLGVVGESGSGKTTLGRMILHLLEPTEGTVLYRGEDIFRYGVSELKQLRRRMQVVFQNPYTSLDGRQSVGSIIAEPLVIHGLKRGRERRTAVHELMQMVGLSPDDETKYPHQFSGGQRQRIGIARALALGPEFLVCDEPVSALDVSIKAQIVNLLLELQSRLELTYMFISHDLGVVRHVSDRVAVMYLGRLMELAPNREIYHRPYHPYTEALLASIPVPDPETRRTRSVLQGDIPTSTGSTSGCVFERRCKYAGVDERCRMSEPDWTEVTPGHWARCWRIAEIRDLSPDAPASEVLAVG